MGEKGTRDFEKLVTTLPTGYHLGPIGDDNPKGGVAKLDGPRPGLPISWDDEHGTWRPPGFVPASGDPDRLFNQTTGQNAVWDDKAGGYIDTQTGKAIGYEQ